MGMGVLLWSVSQRISQNGNVSTPQLQNQLFPSTCPNQPLSGSRQATTWVDCRLVSFRSSYTGRILSVPKAGAIIHLGPRAVQWRARVEATPANIASPLTVL